MANIKKPYMCLNMIVKNEAHIIKESLEALYKHIDYYVINDTGSTDDTIQTIKNFFNEKNIPGEVIEHEFRTCTCHTGIYKKYDFFHFGWNRTFALDCCIGKSEYIFVMDADDLPMGNFSIPKNLDKDYYSLKFGDYICYHRPQIFKNDKSIGWFYNGGLHEIIDSFKQNTTNEVLQGDYYIDSRRLGDRSKDPNKYLNDAKRFEILLKDEPDNERYVFYCANSYFDHGDFISAIKWYEKKIKISKIYEEVYYSHMKIAWSKQELKKTWNDIEKSFLNATDCYKYRSEALYYIAEHYLNTKEYKKAYEYAKKASKIKLSKFATLFINKSVYDWRIKDAIAQSAYNLGKYIEAATLYREILDEKLHDKNDFDDLKLALKECEEKISDQNKQTVCFYLGNEYLVHNNATHKIINHAMHFYKVIIVGNKVDPYCVDNVVILSVDQYKKTENFEHIDYFIIVNNLNFYYDTKNKYDKIILIQYDDEFHVRLDNGSIIGIHNHIKLNELFKNITKILTINENLNDNYGIDNVIMLNDEYHNIYENNMFNYEFTKTSENHTNGYVFVHPSYICNIVDDNIIKPYLKQLVIDYGTEIMKYLQNTKESYYNMACLQLQIGNTILAENLIDQALKINNNKQYDDVINLKKADLLFQNKKYMESYNLANNVLNRNVIPEKIRDNAEKTRDVNIDYIKDSYLLYPSKKIQTLKNNSTKKILFSITTCKRYDLFEKTMNSFINTCLDCELVDYWLCVDDNSSEEDRKKMQQKYPFFNFIWKSPSEKGHYVSMNMIYKKNMEGYTYNLHMEDDFHFVQKRNYITESIKVLQEPGKIGQVLFNRNYAEVEMFKVYIPGGILKLTKDGMRYIIHEHYDTESEEYAKFIEKHKGHGTNCYWPHFSFRPSLLKTSMLKDIGEFYNTSHFERAYANEYNDKKYVSAYLDTFSCIHIGKKTWENNVKNSYNLNEVGQFNVVNNKVSINVLSLNNNPDQWKKFKESAKVLNHYVRKYPKNIKELNNYEKQIFKGNNFNYLRPIINRIMDHIDLIKNNNSDFLVVLKDNILLKNNFDDLLVEQFDMIILDHHIVSDNKLVKYDYDQTIVLENLSGYILSKSGVNKILRYIDINGIKSEEYLNAPNIIDIYVLNNMMYEIVSIKEKKQNVQIKNIPGYIFYSQLDSYGNDEGYYGGKTVNELKNICDSKGCVAFNTLGYIKNKIVDESEFIYLPKSKTINQGMYVKIY